MCQYLYNMSRVLALGEGSVTIFEAKLHMSVSV